MQAYLSIIIAVIGLLMYALSDNAKVAEIGRIMFWTGLLSFLLQGGGQSVGLFK